MERMRWRLTAPLAFVLKHIAHCFFVFFLSGQKGKEERGEVKKLACYPVTPPRHTVPPAQVEPADPKEKGGRGFTRGQDASSPNPTQLCRL